MKIRLDHARSEPIRWKEALELAPAELERPELFALTAVEVDGVVEAMDPDFLLRMRLAYSLTAPCDRCLRPVEMALTARPEFLVIDRDEARGKREVAEDDVSVVEAIEGEIETRPLVVEQVQLNLPTRVLCREDCQGLCPRCGEDRNTGACRCPQNEPDERWAALAELKARLDSRDAG